MSLARLYLLKAHLNVQDDIDDLELAHYLQVGEEYVKTYTGRQLTYGQYTEEWIEDELPRKKETYLVLWLRETPVDIAQAVQVYIDGELQADEPFTVKEDGRIALTSEPSHRLKIVYYAGYKDPAQGVSPYTPADLEQAIITIAGLLYQEKKGTFGVKSVALGDESVSAIEQFVPERIKRILDAYRRIGL